MVIEDKKIILDDSNVLDITDIFQKVLPIIKTLDEVYTLTSRDVYCLVEMYKQEFKDNVRHKFNIITDRVLHYVKACVVYDYKLNDIFIVKKARKLYDNRMSFISKPSLANVFVARVNGKSKLLTLNAGITVEQIAGNTSLSYAKIYNILEGVNDNITEEQIEELSILYRVHPEILKDRPKIYMNDLISDGNIYEPDISILIKALANRDGLTVNELAKKAKTKPETIKRWMSGETIPSPLKLKDLSIAFSVPLTILIEIAMGDKIRKKENKHAF